MRPRRFALGLLALTALALAVRVAFTVIADPKVPRVGDASAYHLLANNLAAGRGYIRPYDLSLLHRIKPTAEYPPLFPAVVAVASVLGIKSVEGQRLWMCVVGAGTVALIGLLGRRVAGPRVGLVAALLAALYPMLFQPDAVLMPETLYAFLVVAAVLLAYRAADRPSPLRFAALGAVIGLAALTRAEALLLIVVVAVPVALGLAGAAGRRRVALAAFATVAAVVVVGTWTVRNATTFHAFVPVSNNVGSALSGANCDATYHGSQKGLWLFTCFGGFELDHDDEAHAATLKRQQGLRYMNDHRSLVPGVMAVRWARTFAVYDVGHQIGFETFEGRTRRWQTLGVRYYWVLLPFAAAGVALLVRRRARLLPLLAPFALVSLTAALTYGNQRFRIAAEPSLVVLAAVPLGLLLDRRAPAAAAAAR